MANWIDRFFPKQLPTARGGNLPATSQPSSPPAVPAQPERRRSIGLFGQSVPQDGKLPNATVIYAMGASALCVMALYLVFTGHFFTGLLVLVLAACFLGFALHFLRHRG